MRLRCAPLRAPPELPEAGASHPDRQLPAAPAGCSLLVLAAIIITCVPAALAQSYVREAAPAPSYAPSYAPIYAPPAGAYGRPAAVPYAYGGGGGRAPPLAGGGYYGGYGGSYTPGAASCNLGIEEVLIASGATSFASLIALAGAVQCQQCGAAARA
jgi:hypothetical protein